jgi:hypothetical protein
MLTRDDQGRAMLRMETRSGGAGKVRVVQAVGAMLAVCMVAGTSGCVRRTLTINTEPRGAIVWLNDEEVGRSPVSVDFLWYGDYSVIARLDGYETLNTHEAIAEPWYQWPGIDFFTEVLWPGRIHDQRSMSFALSPAHPPDRAELLSRAQAFRHQTLFGVEETASPSNEK